MYILHNEKPSIKLFHKDVGMAIPNTKHVGMVVGWYATQRVIAYGKLIAVRCRDGVAFVYCFVIWHHPCLACILPYLHLALAYIFL